MGIVAITFKNNNKLHNNCASLAETDTGEQRPKTAVSYLQSKAVISSGRTMITKGFLVTLLAVLYTKAGQLYGLC